MRVVLVRPRHGGNVGAACRALKNMGAGGLWIAGGDFELSEARRTAVHADDVLEARSERATLADAIEGCSLVVGTTARRGAYRERSRDIRDLADEIAACERSGEGRVPALVFGPEDTGLTNEDIALCHHLAFVPTDAAYVSLNLAQAVLLCLYEVSRARAARAAALDTCSGARAPKAAEAPPPATGAAAHPRADAADVERMYAELEAALLAIGFLSEDNPKHVMLALRALFGRAGLDARELRMLRGVARQIRWFAEGGRETALRKRARGEKLR